MLMVTVEYTTQVLGSCKFDRNNSLLRQCSVYIIKSFSNIVSNFAVNFAVNFALARSDTFKLVIVHFKITCLSISMIWATIYYFTQILIIYYYIFVPWLVILTNQIALYQVNKSHTNLVCQLVHFVC